MLRSSIIVLEEVSLLPRDKRNCAWIADWIMIQCILVFIGSATIVYCVWSPEHSTKDYDKLFRIMYLYDPHACGYHLRSSNSISNLKFTNDTLGSNLLPIEWMPPVMTVSTRLSSKTRNYIQLSALVHIIWFLVAVLLRIFRFSTRLRILKLVLSTTMYVCIFIIIFDLSMAIVYIAHIQQSLTKGMILRYSGWSVEMKINRYDDFGGWLPMAASTCWMRGVVILVVNIYCCRVLLLIRRTIKKREVKEKITLEENIPIPEPKYEEPTDDEVLYFRTGEHSPYSKKSNRSMWFFD